MPRACLVEIHVTCYSESLAVGCHELVSWRLTLPATGASLKSRCHELVSWMFTLPATQTAMFIQPYLQNELHFAYCYRVYLRWRTHRARPLAPLAELDQSVLESIAGKYGIRVLEYASNATDLMALVSLKPE